jgi:hypothetical protein
MRTDLIKSVRITFESLSAEMQDAVRARHESFSAAPRPAFLKPKDASNMGAFKDTYVVYSQFSADAAHPTITALARHWGPAGDTVAFFDAQPPSKEDELDGTLHLACIAVISMMVLVNEMFDSPEAGKKLLDINHDLKLLQAERWGADTINEGMEIITEQPRTVAHTKKSS